MFDLVSTHHDIEIQAQRSAQLLAAVISKATTDLMERPTTVERRKRINLNEDALSSLTFFFGKNNERFKNFSRLIGMNPESFLDRLETINSYDAGRGNKFTGSQLRALHLRVVWYKMRRGTENYAICHDPKAN